MSACLLQSGAIIIIMTAKSFDRVFYRLLLFCFPPLLQLHYFHFPEGVNAVRVVLSSKNSNNCAIVSVQNASVSLFATYLYWCKKCICNCDGVVYEQYMYKIKK